MRTFRRAPSVLHDVLDDRAMLIDADGTELIRLNRVGTLVWQGLDGERDSARVSEGVADLFKDVEPARIGRDVELFLDQLQQLGLVEEVDVPTQRSEPTPDA